MQVSHMLVVDSAFVSNGVEAVTMHATTDGRIVLHCETEYSESFLRYVQQAMSSYSAHLKYEQSRQSHNDKVASERR